MNSYFQIVSIMAELDKIFDAILESFTAINPHLTFNDSQKFHLIEYLNSDNTSLREFNEERNQKGINKSADCLSPEWISLIDNNNFRCTFRICAEIIKDLTLWSGSIDDIIQQHSNKDTNEIITHFLKKLQERKILVDIKNKKEIQSNELQILHLSDLQFGNDVDPFNLNYFEENLKKQAKKGLNPDIVVLTGDVTTQAKIEEFLKAEHFLSFLNIIFPYLRKDKIFIIPGNHDLSRFLSSIHPKFKFDNFKQFYESFFRQFWLERNPVTRIELSPLGSLPIICLDSCSMITHHPHTHKIWRIADKDLLAIIGNLANVETNYDYFVFLYLIHHPPSIIEDFIDDTLRQLKRGVAKPQIHIFLHGHTHSTTVPNIFNLDGNLIAMSIGAASPIIKPEWRSYRGYEAKNQFNYIKFNFQQKLLTIDLSIFDVVKDKPPKILRYEFEFGTPLLIKATYAK